MTRSLQEAIEHLKDLPEEEQDAAADAVFAYMASDERQYVLRPDHVREVRRIRDDLKSGKTRLATDDEVSRVRRKSAI
jgi:hypothetical protein